MPAISLTGIERTRCAFGAVNAGTDNKVDLVNQPGAQKRHVSCAAPFYQQPFHAEFAVENFQRQDEVDLGFPGEKVVHAFAAQPRQVRIRNRFGKDDDDWIAADIGPAPSDLAVRVEDDAIRLCFRAG